MKQETFINENRPHESAIKHVSGRANYTDDIAEPPGTLYGAIGWSKKAHAIIKKIDLHNSSSISIDPDEGDIVIFPSKTIHSTQPNASNKERLLIHLYGL